MTLLDALGRQIDRAGALIVCRGCSCDDNHACIDARGQPCSWVLLDVDTPTGVCSSCAEELDWDYEALQLVGRDRDGVPIVLKRALAI